MKKKYFGKRIISLVLTLLLMLGMIPMSMLSTYAALSITGIGGCSGNHTRHTPLVENPSGIFSIKQSGEYYLTGDHTHNKAYNYSIELYPTAKNVTICLNGYKITNTSKCTYMFFIHRGVTVNLCDCKSTGALIYSNNNGSGLAFVDMNSTFNMYAGKLQSNTVGVHTAPTVHSGVACATFNMYGGTISAIDYAVHNKSRFNYYGGTITSRKAEGAVNNDIHIDPHIITDTGDMTVRGSKTFSLYLSKGMIINTSKMGGGKITVNAESNSENIAITGSNNNDISSYFASNKYGYTIINGDNNVVMLHKHKWQEATCKTAKYCDYCGQYTGTINSNRHASKETYFKFTDDKTHSEYYSCCDALKETVDHIEFIKADCVNVSYCDICENSYGATNPDNHTSEDTYYQLIDNSTHGLYHSCCDAFVLSDTHTPDTLATCTNQAHCSVCLSIYGETNGKNHTGELVWDTDNYRHIKKWTCCGATEGVQETHTPDFKINEAGTEISADCSVCGHYLGACSINFADDGIAYDGKKHKAEINGWIYCAYGDKYPTITYWQDGNQLNIKQNSGVANAGTYTIRLSTANNSYYIEKEVTIKKRELTIDSVKIRDKSYDGNNVVTAYGANLNNVVEGEEVFCGIDGTVIVNGNTVGEYKTVTGIEAVRPYVSYIESYAGDNYYVTVDPKAEYPVANGGCYIYECTLNIAAHNQSITNGEEIDQTAYTIENLSEGYEISGIKLETNDYNNVIDVNPYDAVITLNGEDVTNNFDYSTFSGILEVVCQNHSFDSNGFCSTRECNVYQTPAYTLDEFNIKTYTITNAGELYFYANQVNTYGLNDTKAILDNNIVIPATVSQGGDIPDWTPINNLYADFDGNGYSISGLYVDSENDYVGLFGNHGYYEVKNLTIKDSYFKGNDHVGAIAGYSEGNFNNCAVMDDVTVIGNALVGGISGETMSTKTCNCMSLANVQGNNFTGGLIGYNYTNINSCYTNAGKLVGSHSDYYGSEITNSYYLADEETDEFDGTTAVKAEDFASGKLTYILQSGVVGEEIYDENLDEWVTTEPSEVWGQNLGVDKYPMLNDYKVYYGYKDCMATEKIYDNLPLSNEMIGHTHVWGDVDLDNRVTILDATALAKSLAGITTLTDCQQAVADVNNDGMININDVTYIQMMLADLV